MLNIVIECDVDHYELALGHQFKRYAFMPLRNTVEDNHICDYPHLICRILGVFSVPSLFYHQDQHILPQQMKLRYTPQQLTSIAKLGTPAALQQSWPTPSTPTTGHTHTRLLSVAATVSPPTSDLSRNSWNSRFVNSKVAKWDRDRCR